MPFLPDEIKDLCYKWCDTVQKEDGAIAIGGESEKYRLLRNGVQFHELDFEQLLASASGLTKVLLLPGLNTFIDQDHFGLWSWCAEVLLSRESRFFSDQEMELRKLFETCVRSSLANCRKPASNQEEWERQVAIDQQIPHHARYFIQEASLSLAYLGFPLLEAICKKTCHEYVSINGRVVSDFQVPNYKPDELKNYSKGRTCSSLRDLLFLLYRDVASKELCDEIDEFRDHIQGLDPSKDPFGVIYDWRNQSLHGTTNFQTIGGTLLNLSIIICLFGIKDQYSDIRDRSLERCRWEGQHGHKSPWSFYPPY